MNLKIDVSEQADLTIVELTGEIDVYTTPMLVEKLNPLTEVKGIMFKLIWQILLT